MPISRPSPSSPSALRAMTADTAPTVLIIEDDTWVREITRDLLVEEGFVVASASEGQTGLELAKRLRPDVILLDLVMPRGSGVEFLGRLRNDPHLCQIP